MKKSMILLGFAAMVSAATQAQEKKTITANPSTQTAPTSILTQDNMVFSTEKHDFGTLKEGDKAEFIFAFKNTGKEPIVIQRVQPSCGCTTPDWTREPIPPGKSGMVKASYGTQGRPGPFNKTLTVFSNAGTKTLFISGNVEKAPENSVPQNNSLIRTN